MKKYLIALAALVAMLPGLASAGLQQAGYIYITQSPGMWTLSATMSVRNNPATGNSYIGASSSYGTVSFYGYNSIDGTFFSCSVSSSSSLYPMALQTIAALDTNTWLAAQAPVNFGPCSHVSYSRTSYN
jgi:hypothetical protein